MKCTLLLLVEHLADRGLSFPHGLLSVEAGGRSLSRLMAVHSVECEKRFDHSAPHRISKPRDEAAHQASNDEAAKTAATARRTSGLCSAPFKFSPQLHSSSFFSSI